MKLYGLKNCDTCRKAFKTLKDAEFVDVRAEGIPFDVLKTALSRFGDKLTNTRSTTWRALDEEQRSQPDLERLIAHPSLMKRPLIQADDGNLYLGWGADTRDSLGVE